MKNVRLLSSVTVFIPVFFCFAFFGCTGKRNKSGLEEIIREVQSLDKMPLKSFKAVIRSRDEDSYRVIITDYYEPSKGGVLLKINEGCVVFESESINWERTTLNGKTTKGISKCFCEIGINAIAVDSCRNTYFSISQVDKYEFVLLENKDCLDDRFNYVRLKDKCYKIK